LILTPADQRTLSQYVSSISGIHLDDTKGYLIENRLSRLALDLGCANFGDLARKAQADGAGRVKGKIIDAITTGETLFFRDMAPFDLLRHKLLPELFDHLTRTNQRRPVRIWSAASSTGQEAYSIAILWRELLGPAPRLELRLVGTDISDQAVARATSGTYSAHEVTRGMSEPMLAKYLVRQGDQYQVRPDIRQMATFRTFNLLNDFAGLGRFDIIFCRNVAIYFPDAVKTSLFTRLGRQLETGGSLIIGAMESLASVCPQFISKRHLRAVYYQLQ
jgi:chemotaxis protein methyltransferase CheR